MRRELQRLREENQNLRDVYAHKNSSNMFQYVGSAVLIASGVILAFVGIHYFTTVKLLEKVCLG